MRLEIENNEPWTVMKLGGDLNAEAGTSIYLRFHRELIGGRRHFLFHLEQATLVDSSGLALLVRCYKDAKARGGELALCAVPGNIRKVLEFTTLDNIFRIGDESMTPLLPPDLQAA